MMAATARPVGVAVSIPSRMARNMIRRSLRSAMVRVTSETERPNRSIAATTPPANPRSSGSCDAIYRRRRSQPGATRHGGMVSYGLSRFSRCETKPEEQHHKPLNPTGHPPAIRPHGKAVP